MNTENQDDGTWSVYGIGVYAGIFYNKVRFFDDVWKVSRNALAVSGRQIPPYAMM